MDGRSFADPRPGEMNSHDILDKSIEFQKAAFVSKGKLRLLPGARSAHNTNADMSYIPVYPGLSGEAALSSFGGDYIRAELLGKSKDLDVAAGRVNLSVDPYFDMNRITEDYVFGRVYEDFQKSLDKSLLAVRNPSINSNQRKAQIAPGYFIWTL